MTKPVEPSTPRHCSTCQCEYGSKYVEVWALLNGLPTTPEQDAACLFLESKGMTFCVHYGYENAISKAQQYREWATPGRA